MGGPWVLRGVGPGVGLGVRAGTLVRVEGANGTGNGVRPRTLPRGTAVHGRRVSVPLLPVAVAAVRAACGMASRRG